MTTSFFRRSEINSKLLSLINFLYESSTKLVVTAMFPSLSINLLINDSYEEPNCSFVFYALISPNITEFHSKFLYCSLICSKRTSYSFATLYPKLVISLLLMVNLSILS